MTRADTLLHSFDCLWQEFFSTTRKALEKASEKPIHHLRITARRLIAALDLLPEMALNKEVTKVRKRFKKILKWTSPLRDVHVQLAQVKHMSNTDLRKFAESLKRKEEKKIARIQEYLEDFSGRRFAKRIKAVRAELDAVHKQLGSSGLQNSVTQSLQSRATQFHQSSSKFRPTDNDALHKMRISLKKLRYGAEAARPVLGNSVVEEAQQLKAFQQLIGDARDATILSQALEKWASRKDKPKVVQEPLKRLTRQQANLLRRISETLPSVKRMNIAKPNSTQSTRRKQSVEVGQRRRDLRLVEKTLLANGSPNNAVAATNELSETKKEG